MSFLRRRSFLQFTGLFPFALFWGSPEATTKSAEKAVAAALPPADGLEEEEFWQRVRQEFTTSASLINFNNGGVSPAPRTVQEAMKRYYDYSNEAPTYFMWRILDAGRENLRASLAGLGGCSPEEICINRNASEGLETVIFGLPLRKGDEVVAARQDYPNMVQAWKQRELRDGIRVKWINLELPSEDEDYLVRQYTSAFTSRTKVVHLTHMINWNGQVIPVRKIADAAHRQGTEVLVDGAHTFAQLQFNIPDLGSDYFATSLHKWLYAPIGSGMLYVKKEKIPKLCPFFAAPDPAKDDIRKFEHLGTRPFFIEQAIAKAIDFHHWLGAERKQERLCYLKNYWMKGVQDCPGVELLTSSHPRWGGAIGMVRVKDKKPGELGAFLMDRYKIHTSVIEWENIKGVRITPNVYTSLQELDLLVEGIRAFAKG